MQPFPSSLWKFVYTFVQKSKWGFLGIFILNLCWTIDQVTWPIIIGYAVDALKTFDGPRSDIWHAISGVVIIGALLWITIEIMARACGFLSAKIYPTFEANVRMAMFEHMNHHSHSFFSNNFAGSMANKINDMPRSLKAIFDMVFEMFLPNLLTFLLSSIIFAFVHPIFGIIIFVWVAIHMGVCMYASKTIQRKSDVHAESRSSLAGRIVDSFSNNLSVRIFSRKKHEVDYTYVFQKDEIAKYKDVMFYMEKVKIFLGIFCFLFIGVFLTWAQIHMYKTGQLTLGELVYLFQAAWHVTIAAWMTGLRLPDFFREIGVCRQAFSLISTPFQITDKFKAQPIKIKNGKIEFRNVTFSYERNNNVFDEQSITINPKEKVGLVGFSGSGKTTFANLIMRHFDIKSGMILIDGYNIKDVKQDSLREQISMIPQDPSLFHRTLIENIRYGNLKASDKQVVEAAKKAFCHDFIMDLPDKYNTVVGERGLKLSGGQRQRIAIARAILKKSPILIMDEATSALDSVTENQIQKSIKSASKNSTTIIIAHRLSTLSEMDRILVFDKGHIVEDGTHEELISKDSHYKKLWDMQIDGLLPNNPEYKYAYES